MLSYRAILKQSWRISWKYKFLWFFGFFASLISFTAEFKIIARSINQESGIRSLNNIKMFLNTGVFSKDAWLNILGMLKTDPKSILMLFLVLIIILAIIIFFAWLSTASQIGIINSVDKIIKNKKDKLNIKSALKRSHRKFWPVFIMNLVMSIIINLIYILISFLLVLVIIKNQALSSLIYGFIFIIFIPISLFISFIIKYAIASMVIENKKFFPALQQGWKLFFNNWLISIEVAIILFFINVLVLILLSVISFIGFFLFFSLALSTIFVLSSGFLFWLVLIIGFLLILAIMILGGSLLNVFQISSWTDLFIRIREGGASSKIERIFQD
ncbi:MAG: hypothetical protein PHP37_00730 [Patescibacteria group bacterium]|nr:hypothetical protein [Patescibacteria group bacterium]